MKPNKILQELTVMILLALIYVNCAAQTDVTADTIRNTCGEGSSDILFQLCDSTVMRLEVENGNVRINTNLEVPNGNIYVDSIKGNGGNEVNIGNNLKIKGSVTADSLVSASGDLKINSNLNLLDKWIHADSVRCRVIHVGDSSIIIGNQGVGSTNSIYTTNGALQIQSRPTNNFNTIINAGTLARVCNSCLF